jgi:hypothetical protein
MPFCAIVLFGTASASFRPSNECHRPMRKKQVQIIELHIVEDLVEAYLHCFGCVEIVPELRRDEYLGAGDARVTDCFADLAVDTVVPCAVEVAVASFESGEDGFLDPFV